MALDLITSILVGFLGIVSAALFIRGLLGIFATDHEPHYPWS